MGVPAANTALNELLALSGLLNENEAALLSASDLIVLLERIRTRSDGIKEKVRRTVSTYSKEFAQTISQASDTAADVVKVSDELHRVLGLFGDRGSLQQEDGSIGSAESLGPHNDGKEGKKSLELVPVDVQICNLASKIRGAQTRIEEHENALVIVKRISSYFQLLLAAEKNFTPARLVETAKMMRALQTALRVHSNVEGTAADEVAYVQAFQLLRDAWSVRFPKFCGILDDIFSKAVIISELKKEVVVNSVVSCEYPEATGEVTHVELTAIFTAMDILEVLEGKLAILGDALYKHVFNTILGCPTIAISTAVFDRKASLSLQRQEAQEGEYKEKPALLFSKLVQVVKFFREHVFLGDKEKMTRLGLLLWPRLAEAIISSCLQEAVPNETSQLKDFHHVADMTKNFEEDLAGEGLIPKFELDRGDRLSDFALNVEVHFAAKKKKQLLAQARDVLIQADYSFSGSSSGVSDKNRSNSSRSLLEDLSVFPPLESWTVSHAARALLTIVHQAIEDACLATPKTALVLYHAARDVVVLYHAIIPVKLESKFRSLGRASALCHNDCLFLAHELLTLRYQYESSLPPNLENIFTFVDLVPIFRRLAEELLQRQISFADEELMLTLEGTRQDQQQPEITSQSMLKVKSILDKLATSWGPVLPASVYERVMSGLINHVIIWIVSEILNMKDITEEETFQLQEPLLYVQDSFPAFLVSTARDGLEKQSKEVAERLVPSWGKLKGLLNLLDMSLVSITQAWESGDLSSRGFSAAEIAHFIRAIFFGDCI